MRTLNSLCSPWETIPQWGLLEKLEAEVASGLISFSYLLLSKKHVDLSSKKNCVRASEYIAVPYVPPSILHCTPTSNSYPYRTAVPTRPNLPRLPTKNAGRQILSSISVSVSNCRLNLHYARFGHHCRSHHCRICENRQRCTFTAGYELENKKIIGAGLKPAVKHHITTGLWLESAVFLWSLITASSSHNPAVIWLYHCWF